MMNSNNKKPVVLVIAGHDPSGGAGIQADIESIANAGCHAATVITSLTTQKTNQIIEVLPQNPEPFRKQIRLILEDMEIAACKIGMIGSLELIDVIQRELSEVNVPIVLDPIISATTGKAFADKAICENLLSALFPLTSLVTPNSDEAKQLSQSSDQEVAANKLLSHGTKNVLITGADEDTNEVVNTLYTSNNPPINYHWERLTGLFHGSGCTLSSRIAALLAQGDELESAVKKAQSYTWNTLKQGLKLGQGQIHPNRFYE